MIERRKTSQQQGFWNFIKFILQAGYIVSLIHAFAFKPFHIHSGSMIPSLLVKDYPFVSKYTYGFSRYAIPFGYMFNYFNGRILQFASPQRGMWLFFVCRRIRKLIT